MSPLAPPTADPPTSGGPAYAEALARLHALGRLGVDLGLERIARVLGGLGDPQRRYASIHLAGTNGKGSTAAMLAACLREAGLRTGLYTSPHLCRFSERIQVDGREIPPDRVATLLERVLALDPALTFFEAATAIGLLHLAEEGVEVAVVETGLGGRLDATNVVAPRVSVITRLGLDHQELLGPDLASIAREKAGIIKAGTPVVAAAAEPEAEAVLHARCAEVSAPLLLEGRDFEVTAAEDGASYRGQRGSLAGLALALRGEHQQGNAALCLAALEVLGERGPRIPEAAIRRGLAAVRWPGRLEWIGEHLLDGAHNPAGARVLARYLEGQGRPLVVVAGILGPKDPAAVLAPILPHASALILTRPRSARALPPGELAAAARGLGYPGRITEAPGLEAALAGVKESGPVLITGSLYLVGEARALLLGEPVDPLPTADPIGATAQTLVAGSSARPPNL